MLGFIKNLKIARKFALLAIIIAIGFGAFGVFSYSTLTLVMVNGPLYHNIVQGKDLIADILPPPDYLVESYLVVFQMIEETNPSKVQELTRKCKSLRDDYESRHQYWKQDLPEGQLKELMVETSYRPAIRFLDLRDSEFMSAIARGDKQAARQILQGPLAQAYEEHRNAIDKVVELATERNKLDETKTASTIAQRTFAMVALAFGVVAIVCVLSFFIARNIGTPIGQVISNIDNADLNSRLATNRRDEIGDLQRSFDKFVDTIKATLIQVAEASAAVASASSEISSSTEQMAAGAQEQTSQAGEVASAVEQMTKTIVENSRNASSTADTAKKARVAAEQGGVVVDQTVAGMRRIADVVKQSAGTVQELGRSSDQIGEITSVIDDIADQTNLLALNAAIEAARAGEQGRGFAVVADEVRKLAERTTKATKEIAGMIKKIQGETKGAVISMGEGTKQVDDGILFADKAGSSLRDIVEISQRVTDMVAQIAAASEEQSSASEQISKNVEAISNVTGETAQGVQQIARAAEDLNRLTEGLQQILSKFNLGGDTGARLARSLSSSPKTSSTTPRSSVSVKRNVKLVPYPEEA
jgi:methyl-accepting chemotaxis protein